MSKVHCVPEISPEEALDKKLKELTDVLTRDDMSALTAIEESSREILMDVVSKAVTDEPPSVLEKLLKRLHPQFGDLVSPDYSPFAHAYIKGMYETCRILEHRFPEFRGGRSHDGILPTLLESEEYHKNPSPTCGRMIARYPHLIPDIFMNLLIWNLDYAKVIWVQHAMNPACISAEQILAFLEIIESINDEDAGENLSVIEFLLETNILREEHISGFEFIKKDLRIFKAIEKKLRLSDDFLKKISEDVFVVSEVRSYARGQILIRASANLD